MIYYYKSELYFEKIDIHNDVVKNGAMTDDDVSCDSDSEGSYDSGSDSSMEGRERWRPTRFTNYGSKIPKKYRKSWRLN